MTNVELNDKEQQTWNLIKDMKIISHPHFFHLVRSRGIYKRASEIANLLRNLDAAGRVSINRHFQIVIHNKQKTGEE